MSPAAAPLTGATSLTVATHAAAPVVVWRRVAEPGAGPIVVGVDTTAVAPWRGRHPEVEVLPFVTREKPAAALLRHSEGWQIVVVGSHRHSTVASVATDSSSLKFLHSSEIPVLVCHAKEVQ
ncbi:hypothetical protein D8S82_15350 [Mycobacterium hodleri]|uniref:UspA domain-containing protein n=1 Tax=Mycolicibacterium hodleri TaxID=49897 RepID=A0A544W0E2_9MYCO|nr:universal stress protein [Mycolicibacterium hodleri]TQR85708.1 hypothetical protein D8S82_15350 [Mycolicibacterium hodleri]